MESVENKKPYDLEARTLQYTKDVIALVKHLPKNTFEYRDCKAAHSCCWFCRC
jgi:hypothetical protein